ncbi:MAG: metallophosphoesterase family protein [Nanoarchaeota archaeon]
MKFAHLADCHLGGWRQEELQGLNFQSFKRSIQICLEEKVDFILISGDLFDSAYPPIEILKQTFGEFRNIKDANIPVFIIAGSHDFSASGKTFLDVLEKSGFCKNIENMEIQNDGKIKLYPYKFNDVFIFGYSGKKSGMEIEDLKKVYFDSVYPFSIFMIHTTIKDVVGNLPMDSIDTSKLPLANYYAMGHIHKIFEKQEAGSIFAYPGPIFPNNFQELVDLKFGSFNLVEFNNGKLKINNLKIPLIETVYLEIELDNALTATEKIISEFDKYNLKNQIVLMKLKGTINQGKTGDIRFNEIEEFIQKKQAYSFLRNISSLKIKDSDIKIATDNVDNLEEAILKEYIEKNEAEFNKYLPSLINSLSVEKNEDEKNSIFENRIIDDLKKIFNLQNVI